MSYVENAKKYYWDKEMNCAEGILLGGSDTYDLGVTEKDVALFSGFGGGIGCGKICGCAAGAVGVLGKLFSDRDDFRDICAAFVSEFEEGLGCGTIDCDVLKEKYKTEENRCLETVTRSAELLEKFIEKYR